MFMHTGYNYGCTNAMYDAAIKIKTEYMLLAYLLHNRYRKKFNELKYNALPGSTVCGDVAF